MTEANFSVPPARIFAVLSDPESSADWVVGSHSIRDADPNWPAVGSRFYHRVGTGPLTVKDRTEVLQVDPPHPLVHHRSVESLRRLRLIAETGVLKT